MTFSLSWCRHLLVSFVFHDFTSLHSPPPPSFHRNDFPLAYFTVARELLGHHTIATTWLSYRKEIHPVPRTDIRDTLYSTLCYSGSS